jgi:hypothetical protein
VVRHYPALVLAVVSALYAAAHFAINTDAAALLPRDLPWRQSELSFKATFPQRQMLVVVDTPTPELADIAAARLAAGLEKHHDRFRSVRQLRGNEFFERSALLYPPVDQVTRTTQQFREAGPVMSMLGADPSLRGVMQALTFGARSAHEGRVPPTALTRPMSMLSNTLDDLFAGRRAISPGASWVGSGDLDPSSGPVAIKIQESASFEPIEEDFPRSEPKEPETTSATNPRSERLTQKPG